jgi:hypothetical protein
MTLRSVNEKAHPHDAQRLNRSKHRSYSIDLAQWQAVLQ